VIAAARPLVGTSVHRVEDARILTGRGRFVADVQRPGVLEAAFVRSLVAHARIASVDVEDALAMPGVVAVITAQELNAATEPLGLELQLENLATPSYRPLATDRARFVGDPIALVVAGTRYEAEDARDVIGVECEPLEPILTAEDAHDAAKPPIFDELRTNVAGANDFTFGDPDAAFAAADAVVRLSVDTSRVSQAPIEARGALAEVEAGSGTLTYHGSTRQPHAARLKLAKALRRSLDSVHVVVPDLGGAFGQKAAASREDVAICFAAIKLGRPVRWIEDRGENLSAATQGRGERFDVTAAVRADGTILALDVHATLNQGAYPADFPIALFGTLMRIALPNAYRIDHMRWRETYIVTNTASFGPLRGPWAGETLSRETIVDKVARELGLDPVDVRRRNLVPLSEQPRRAVTGVTLEGVTALDCLERAVDLVGYEQLREEQRLARAQGRLLGIGVATYIEPAPGPPDYGTALTGFTLPAERAIVSLEPDGHLSVFTSQVPHGQGHETTLAQVAANELGVDVERVRIVHGDTRLTPFGTMGTAGSRASSMATGAVLEATRSLKGKVLALAGELLEVSPDDLDLVDGTIVPRGAEFRELPLGQVARTSYFAPPAGEEPGLRTASSYRSGRGGWAGGTHVCVVEVDGETGGVEIRRYVVVEDCGKVINPAIVEGQVRGGVAMGIGIALLEDSRYDEDGNPALTLMDYLLPSAMDVPRIEIEHVHGEPLHELDFRGVGEGGTIVAPPAVANAIADAIGGLDAIRLPLTPEIVLDQLDARRRMP
jgi:aerobic carbon-monoxide dehydrogenase large subunit